MSTTPPPKMQTVVPRQGAGMSGLDKSGGVESLNACDYAYAILVRPDGTARLVETNVDALRALGLKRRHEIVQSIHTIAGRLNDLLHQ